MAKFVQYAVKGCPPEIMGIGPAVAIPELLQKTGIKVSDVDIWEINEAFASQATYSIEHLNIPKEKVNPKGGAIALGHPLGCTGTFSIKFRFKTDRDTTARTDTTEEAFGRCFDVHRYRNGRCCFNREIMINLVYLLAEDLNSFKKSNDYVLSIE